MIKSNDELVFLCKQCMDYNYDAHYDGFQLRTFETCCIIYASEIKYVPVKIHLGASGLNMVRIKQ